MMRLSTLVALTTTWTFVAAHTVITYPGWRGNNLHSNGTVEGTDPPQIPPGSLGINWNATTETPTFPYGQQWMYPCGGMPTSQNRTKWPVKGGAIGVQPGWFSGHSQALFYINMGFGNEPMNMSHPMLPVFGINGPSNKMYKGEFCFPQVPLPVNASVQVGDNATIQIIETAQHGAALYNCVDITFAEPEDVEQVTQDNCRNSTEPGKEISFNLVFTTSSLNAAPSLLPSSILHVLPALSALMVAFAWI
ncbi:hypothetical protein M501DRAFT_943885 [Patellaria atrata CBS 101060]|uniref:Copper acquisition factor BIM1-like domain-containing protein n=1 Tax=Patellaria atrata CBS 101060 TaxID=1346257 RepID=A0A9P4VKK0_9PEZI|nr:hypothetical protein M501DRAFT_943885 [Patellaria atrata CBS 101060]